MSKPEFSVFTETEQWCRLHWPTQGTRTYSEIDSTNLQAKTEALSTSEPALLYLANVQTAGRGRGSNLWTSPASDSSLQISFSFQLEQSPQSITGPLSGLSIFRALKSTWPEIPFRVKAPNDIYITDKKICGILIEVVKQDQTQRLIIGLGMNIFSHPENVSTASHLAHFTLVSKKEWWNFLNHLRTELVQMLKSCVYSELSLKERADLLSALNTGLPKELAFSSMSAKGDLFRGSELISWRDL